MNPRTVLNAILWILGSGAAWRDLPKEYGNWNSIYHKFRSWIEAGVFEKILKSLIDDCRGYYLVEIDSTFCKVHQHAAGARKIFVNQDIGISRGGKTTKIHALVNENFQLLKIFLSGGQFHDGEFSIKLFENLLMAKIKHTVQKSFAYSSKIITQKLVFRIK